MENKFKKLIEDFKEELNTYALLDDKLKEEKYFLKENKTEELLKIIQEKEFLLNKIEEIEKRNENRKMEYLFLKETKNFSLDEIDSILKKINEKLEKLILLQAENSEILKTIIFNFKNKIKETDNIKKFLNEKVNIDEFNYVDVEL